MILAGTPRHQQILKSVLSPGTCVKNLCSLLEKLNFPSTRQPHETVQCPRTVLSAWDFHVRSGICKISRWRRYLSLNGLQSQHCRTISSNVAFLYGHKKCWQLNKTIITFLHCCGVTFLVSFLKNLTPEYSGRDELRSRRINKVF